MKVLKKHVDPKRLALVLFYVLGTISLLLMAGLLVARAQGYRYDFKSGQLLRSGLVLIDSLPRNAHVLIDGKPSKYRSGDRLQLAATTYQLELQSDDYRPWRKNIEVLISQVTDVKYPVLFLNNITTTSSGAYLPPVIFEQSPDKRWVVFDDHTEAEQISLIELGGATLEPRPAFVVPAALAAQGFHLQRASWAEDSEHVLLELSNGTASAYLVIDAFGGDQPVNLTEQLQLPLNNVRFDSRDFRVIYWLDAEVLQQFEIGSTIPPAVIAQSIEAYSVTEQGLFMVRRQAVGRQLLWQKRGGELVVIDERLPEGPVLSMKALEFENELHVAVGVGEKTVLHHDIESSDKLRRELHFRSEHMHVSPEEKFLVFQNQANFYTIDIDFRRHYEYRMPAPMQHLRWYDNFHMIGHDGDSVLVFEFDGGNPEDIVSALNLPAFTDERGVYLYSIGNSSVTGQANLHVSKLREPNFFLR